MGTTNYSSIYTRFEQIASHYGLSFRALGKRLNLSSAQVFYDMKSGKIQGVSRKILESVKENLPEINSSWLVTGDGEMLNSSKKKIPLYDDVTIGGVNEQAALVDDASRPTEWIDAGDWFPSATSAIHHYGDSMVEYPSGCVLVLKRVQDPNLLLNGENYVIETDEYRITKQIQDDGDTITAYSTNMETYPDGRQIHSPIRIPKESIRHLDLVLGCVIKKYSSPIRIR